MSVCTDCNNTNLRKVTTLQNEDGICETIVNETVCVQGTVTIKPSIISGTSTSFCVGNPIIGSCRGKLQEICQFTVSQNICAQIPLTFSAVASAVEDGIVCNTPDIGACEGTTACTHTIGFYKNNPEITNQLITSAGGLIVLGVDSDGLSFTVTTANSNAVLSFNTPSPPAPVDPPFAQQYKNLYAQLLAANLNIIALEAQGVLICEFALDAIDDADQFLADSPSGGMKGAADFQKPLEIFNSGQAQGCPVHCGE